MGGRNQTKLDNIRSETVQLNSVGNENGYFCDVLINGNLVSCLCDSGACDSIINHEGLENMKAGTKPEIVPVSKLLCTVTGEQRPFLGKSVVDINLGGHTFQHEVLISDVVTDGIIGIDFMRANKCDLIISKNHVLVNGDKVPCYLKKDNQFNCCSCSVYL